MRHKKIQTFSYSHLFLYYNMSLTFDINKKNNRSFFQCLLLQLLHSIYSSLEAKIIVTATTAAARIIPRPPFFIFIVAEST